MKRKRNLRSVAFDGFRRQIRAGLLAADSVEQADELFLASMRRQSDAVTGKSKHAPRLLRDLDQIYKEERAKVFPVARPWGGVCVFDGPKFEFPLRPSPALRAPPVVITSVDLERGEITIGGGEDEQA